MKLALGVLVILAALRSAPAQAQESHRFNAKALKAKYTLPVFTKHGRVVNDEIIETTNEFIHETSGIYALKTDVKKVVAWYTKALGEPKEKTTDVGAKKWYFHADDPPDSRTRHQVIVSYDKIARLVQVTLWMRTFQTAADAQY